MLDRQGSDDGEGCDGGGSPGPPGKAIPCAGLWHQSEWSYISPTIGLQISHFPQSMHRRPWNTGRGSGAHLGFPLSHRWYSALLTWDGGVEAGARRG